MRLKLLGSAFFLFVFFLNPLKAFAAEEFSTSYDVTYDVVQDGVTLVTQKINLKNLTSQYYASDFMLTIGSTTASDISASDDSGAMETKVETKENKTIINVKFNQQIAGIDKSQTFTLKFKSKDFAQSIGKTWEINLPKIPESSNIKNYNLVLSVPVAFGDPTSISPNPKSQSQTFDRQFFTFNKNQLEQTGISVNFGTNQVFDFNLKYDLENTSLFPIVTSIALPPDTNYQDVLLSRINPEPLNVTIDEDGNYLAWYQLPKRSKLNISVVGSAKLYISPKSKTIMLLVDSQIQNLTKTDHFWEKDNPSILATISTIFKDGTPKTNREKARLIHRYVVNTLKYDSSRLNNNNIERLGAVTALNNPASAVCMEFTDLFIALARAAGVPARELDGFAYSQNKNLRPLSLNKDLLHAWPEYYDEEKGWIMIDPTWENTSGGIDYFNKFDLNHLVLAVKGISSQTPNTGDDVKTTISQNDFLGKSQLEVNIDISDTIWAGLPANVTIKISNQGNAAQKAATLTINSGTITILGSNTVKFGVIPPFGNNTYKFNLRTPFVWQSFEDNIEVNVAGQKFTKKVMVKPFLLSYPFPYIIVGLVVLGLGIYGVVLTLHLRKKRNLEKPVLPVEPAQSNKSTEIIEVKPVKIKASKSKKVVKKV